MSKANAELPRLGGWGASCSLWKVEKDLIITELCGSRNGKDLQKGHDCLLWTTLIHSTCVLPLTTRPPLPQLRRAPLHPTCLKSPIIFVLLLQFFGFWDHKHLVNKLGPYSQCLLGWKYLPLESFPMWSMIKIQC